MGQDAAPGQLRHPPVDWVVEPDSAAFDEHERGCCRERLAHRRDAEDRVRCHRLRPGGIAVPHRARSHITPGPDEPRESEHLTGVDVAAQPGLEIGHCAVERTALPRIHHQSSHVASL